MAKNRLYLILSRVAEVKPGEEGISFLLFSYFFLVTASFTIIKSLRNAKYLRTYDAIDLPKAYLLAAIVMAFIFVLHSKLERRLSRRALINSSCVFFALSSLIFAFLFLKPWMWVALAFFVWANAFITVLLTQFWIVVNDVFNPREAKRLIGFIGSGGVLGGIAGGLCVGALDLLIHDYLLVVACGGIVINIFVVKIIFERQKRIPVSPHEGKSREGKKQGPLDKVGFRDSFYSVWKNKYLRLIAAVVSITLIVSTLIDWQYNRVIEVSQKPALYASFFGYFNAVFLAVPFFLQLLMTSSIIKRFGIRITLLIYPVILLLCAAAIGFWPSLGFALLIKGSDNSLSFSLNQSARELLYIPVSQELKYKSKVFIDMFVNRTAQSFGALLLMGVLLIPFKFSPDIEPILLWKKQIVLVSLISLALIAIWTFLNVKVSKEYANTIIGKLAQRWGRADSNLDKKLDVGFMKTVIDSLQDRERSSVLYAMDVFDLIRKDQLTPEVRKLISYKQNEMRASALGPLIEGSEAGVAPEIEDVLDEKMLVNEIREIMSSDIYQKVMTDYIDKTLFEKGKASEIERMEIARSIGFMGSDSPLAAKLDDLLRDESPEVRRLALESAARLKRREYVPGIIDMLQNVQTREDAKTALAEFGAGITGTLADYAADRDVNVDIRRAVVSVLGKISNQEAAEFLLWELSPSDESLGTEIIDALDRIRSEKRDVSFREDLVKKKIGQIIQKSYLHVLAVQENHSGIEGDAESAERKKNEADNLMNIFRLLGLIYPRDYIIKAYQNIEAGTKESVAYAVELLDNKLKKEIKDVLFPLIEELEQEDKEKKFRYLLKNFPEL